MTATCIAALPAGRSNTGSSWPTMSGLNGAELSNGLLSIDLVREIPEALKPRKISIQSAPALASAAPAQIEAQKAA
jgi:hypothetical protein